MNKIENKKIDKRIWSIILIIIICLFIPMMINWIFCGEINLSKNNWLVALNGKKWGLLESGNIGYGISQTIECSWEPFIISVSILIFCIVLWFTLCLFNLSKINYFVYIFSTWFLLFLILITGLLPYSESWTIPVRLLIVIVGYFISFILSNLFFNKIIINTRFAGTLANEIIKSEIESKKYLKSNSDSNNKVIKKQKEKIEIDEKDI